MKAIVQEGYGSPDTLKLREIETPVVRVVPFVAKSDSEDLALLAGLVERATITPVIDRRYALNETAEAVRYLGAGHVRGKVAVNTR